jgi:hypothetical protein
MPYRHHKAIARTETNRMTKDELLGRVLLTEFPGRLHHFDDWSEEISVDYQSIWVIRLDVL